MFSFWDRCGFHQFIVFSSAEKITVSDFVEAVKSGKWMKRFYT